MARSIDGWWERLAPLACTHTRTLAARMRARAQELAHEQAGKRAHLRPPLPNATAPPRPCPACPGCTASGGAWTRCISSRCLEGVNVEPIACSVGTMTGRRGAMPPCSCTRITPSRRTGLPCVGVRVCVCVGGVSLCMYECADIYILNMYI